MKMEFNNIKLSKQLLKALEEQDIHSPTPIQEKAIPPILAGEDVVGIAQTGTGKTLAYLLPILRDLKFSEQLEPRALILVPTRELAVQVAAEIKKLTGNSFVRSMAVYGGTNINTQKDAVFQGCDIVVGTPGRLYDLALSGALKLRNIKKLVIDECDEMMNAGFRVQIQRIFDLLPKKRQNLLFSATITEDVENIATTFFRKTTHIFAAPTGTPLENINQAAYSVPNFNSKYALLSHLLQHNEAIEKTFIFVQSKAYANLLHRRLEEDFPEQFGIIHSNKSQNYRLKVVEQFKQDQFKGIVATDLVSRGIDIEEVSHVINFDIPDQKEQYIHRIGRTGRAESKGNSISFVQEEDEKAFQAIQAYMNVQLPITPLPEEVELTTEKISLEEEDSIHDAPTLLTEESAFKRGENKVKKPKANQKRNIKPKERALERKKLRKKRRK